MAGRRGQVAHSLQRVASAGASAGVTAAQSGALEPRAGASPAPAGAERAASAQTSAWPCRNVASSHQPNQMCSPTRTVKSACAPATEHALQLTKKRERRRADSAAV